MSEQYRLSDLLQLMAQLRDADHGCPWDQKQTLATIVPHTLDEVYEVIDAIERQDYPHLQDELGDLLFQVIFYAQICKDEGRFDFNAIVDGLVRKLLRRHPHVYPDGSFASFGTGGELSEAEIKASWERIKAEERAEKPQKKAASLSALDDVAASLPALLRAHKLQKRAASVGFDWQSLKPVIDNLRSEIAELEAAIEVGHELEIADELGDLFFSCVNLARHLKQDSEQVLRQANHKFEQRFRRVEALAQEAGLNMNDCDEAVLDQLWVKAKTQLKNS